jgi:PncC family amidohydrolase
LDQIIPWMHNMNGTLENKLGEKLLKHGLTLATAESCTGGLVGNLITNVAGSSRYYLGGVVAYSYEAKVDLLSVSWDTLNVHGAVCADTVKEMAIGARCALKSNVAVSLSGIAGPDGGTPQKPIGTVWLGLSSKDGSWTRQYTFSGQRMEIKMQAAQEALKFVIEYLDGEIEEAD